MKSCGGEGAMRERLEEIRGHLRESVTLKFTKLEQDIKWLVETVEEQQKEIEHFKDGYQVRRVDLLEEHIDRLEKENARLQKEIERYRDYLKLIRNTGTYGTHIETKDVVRSDEANLAHEALERST